MNYPVGTVFKYLYGERLFVITNCKNGLVHFVDIANKLYIYKRTEKFFSELIENGTISKKNYNGIYYNL